MNHISSRKLFPAFLILFLLIQSLSGILSLPKIPKAYAATSWLSTYTHRVKIPVAATVAGTQTDYQMSIVLHSKSGTNTAGDIYLNGNLQDATAFNDIRFTTSDGTTLKNFWIQKVENETGGRKATVWVKLDTPASGTTDYYLYYGKAGDTSASSYDNTFTKDYGESGLVGLWHMDEGSGNTITDSSGNSNTGTINGASRTATDGGQWGDRADAVFATGSALQFDGIDDYVNASNGASLNITNAITVEAWVNMNNKTSFQNILSKGSSFGAATNYQLGIYNNYLYWTFYASGVAKTSSPTISTLTTGTWNHFVGVYDGTNSKVYINGVNVSTVNLGSLTLDTNSVTLYLGKASNGYFLNGSIDEVRIYNRALSSDEISRQYIRSKYASTAPIWSTPATEEQYTLGVSSQSPTVNFTSATLNGYLTGFGGDTSATVYFKYGLASDNLNQTTATQVMSDYGSFSQAITGLSADTTYYFQAVITDSAGTAYGSVVSFRPYTHRVKIPVSATVAGAQTDYQMSIVLHSKSGTNAAGDIYLNGNLQDTTNFNDIRFTNADGATLRNFWIQKVEDETGGRKATVWVKLDTPASGTTDYYLYYGKAGDTSASSYDNTFTKDYGESGLVGLWHMDEQTPGAELLTDGGLETWTNSTTLTNWTNDSASTGVRDITQESTQKQAGSYSVKLAATSNPSTNFGIYQNITTVNNQQYQVNFYQYYSSRTAGTLKIEAWDNTNSVSLGSESITTAGTALSFTSFRFTSTNTTNVRIKVYLNSETTGTAYIDDLSVKQSSSTATDSSGNSNTGTIYGASRTVTDGGQWSNRSDAVFSTGSSLQFDGIDDYVNAGNGASLTISSALTIEAWVKESNTTAGWQTIADKYGGSSKYWSLSYSGGIPIFACRDTGSNILTAQGNNVLALNTWNHIVATRGNGKFTIYVNGNQQNDQKNDTLGDISNNYNLGIGKQLAGSSSPFNGSIDEVRVYNRALSADEISRHYIRSKYASTAPTWSTPATEEQYTLGVSSQSPTLVNFTSATLNGYLTGFGGDTSATAYFKYGLASDNLNQTTATQVMTDYGSFSQAITGLSADTTYYFQAVITDSAGTAYGSVVSFRTATLDTDYYRTIINTDGSLTFTNKNTNAVILNSSPKFNLNYGSSDYSNGTHVNYNLTTNGGYSVFTSIDDSNPYAKVTHRYELNATSPYIKYTVTLQYKQNVNVTEERFDFTVPSQNAQVMTRDLALTAFDTSQTYWSDLYTPKVVKFTNGLSFLGSDIMDSMRLQASGSNSQLSFYSDYKDDHPHYYVVKNVGTTTNVNETKRSTNDTYSASVTFAIDTTATLKSLVKTRQPYGYDASLVFTNHADSETLARIKAVAYGTEDSTDPNYGTEGIVGRGLGWTKSVFVSGQTGADLQDANFKSLTDQMYQDGVEIVGHSITPGTDSRSTVSSGLQTLSQYNAKDWIDHGATGGTDNWEDLASQGALKGDSNYILDLLDQYNYKYAWSYEDLTTAGYGLNMLQPGSTSDVRPFLFYNNQVDDNVNDSKKIYLWSTVNTGTSKDDLYYTNANVDSLISERGVHIGHEYMGYSTAQNHTWYINPSTGKTEIYPTFDSELAYIATKRADGLIWSPTMATVGDYLVPLKDVSVIYNTDGTYTITNNSSSSITGVTLLAEDNIQSATVDGQTLVSFGGSFGDKEIVLPTLTAGQSVTLAITYGTKDTSVPTIASNDTGKTKVNEITGIWNNSTKLLTMTAEGSSTPRSFTVKIPALADKSMTVKDTGLGTNIGTYTASSIGEITFSAPLGSLHTFSIGDYITLSSPANNSSTSNNQPTLSWNTSSDADSGLAKYQLYIDGTLNRDNISSSATSTTPVSALSDGNHTWYIVAVDAAGNTTQSTSTWTIKVDTAVSTGSSSSSSSNSSSSTSAPSCGDQAPGAKAPWLYGAIAQDSGSVLLYFTQADNPVNKYVLEYGTKSGDYPYGVQDMGVNSRGQMTFLVKSLSPNTTYYFRVRGGNGCATGSWSNEISAKTKGLVSFNQLDITQSELESKPVEETPPTTASCKTYTVKSGDTLWSIAQNSLGDGNRYKEIIEQNKDKYPSLETSNNLEVGWQLKVNCGKQISTSGTQKPLAQGGYDVKVKVVDTNKKPVEGAKVTIHSKVQETVTNKDGIAQFKNVEAGDHKVLIAYNNFEGEQSVNLTGNVKEFDLNVTVQQKAIVLSPLAYGIIGIMGLVMIGLIVLLIKAKRKK